MKNEEKKATYISVAELAKMLGISRISVFNKIKKGQIPAEKIGRSYAILMKDAESMINGSLTENDKTEIKKAVEKVVKEYGDTLKLLGKE